MIELLVARYNFWIAVVLMMLGFYAMMAKRNLLKKLIGMNIFQTSIFLFYISLGARRGGTIPILDAGGPYINPLPHVLILTAIVVSVSTTAVALSVLIGIKRTYGTIEEDELPR